MKGAARRKQANSSRGSGGGSVVRCVMPRQQQEGRGSGQGMERSLVVRARDGCAAAGLGRLPRIGMKATKSGKGRPVLVSDRGLGCLLEV